jgi:hypothetical protein
MEKTIMLLGLTSGEQVIAKVPSNFTFDTTYVDLKNPAILVPANEKGLGMAPWLMYTNAEKDHVRVNTSMIVFVAEPRQEISEQYNTIYGNGLVIPSKKVEEAGLKLVAEEE